MGRGGRVSYRDVILIHCRSIGGVVVQLYLFQNYTQQQQIGEYRFLFNMSQQAVEWRLHYRNKGLELLRFLRAQEGRVRANKFSIT